MLETFRFILNALGFLLLVVVIIWSSSKKIRDQNPQLDMADAQLSTLLSIACFAASIALKP